MYIQNIIKATLYPNHQYVRELGETIKTQWSITKREKEHLHNLIFRTNVATRTSKANSAQTTKEGNCTVCYEPIILSHIQGALIAEVSVCAYLEMTLHVKTMNVIWGKRKALYINTSKALLTTRTIFAWRSLSSSWQLV